MKYISIFMISMSVIIGDEIQTLPYDWAGQYGASYSNHQLIWNQDWTSGALFFDGSFAFYPLRYGPSYQRTYQPNQLFQMNHPRQIPDTVLVTSALDYSSGDYGLNQLILDVDYIRHSQLTRLEAFKRSYYGSRGQYILPVMSRNPNQQSYRIDYTSISQETELEFSLANLITHSGIPDSIGNGSHHDQILSTGVLFTKKTSGKLWEIAGSQFNQEFRMKMSRPEFNSKSYLSRTHFQSAHVTETDSIKKRIVGYSFDYRTYSQKNSQVKQQSWYSIYRGLSWKYSKANYGLNFSSTRHLAPMGSMKFQMENMSLSMRISPRMKPVLLDTNSSKNPFETWYYLDGRISKNWSYAQIGFHQQLILVDNFSLTDAFPLKEISNSVPGNLVSSLWIKSGNKKLMFNGEIAYSSPNTSITDGFGTTINISLEHNRAMFNDNLLLNMKLTTFGGFQRNKHIIMDPYLGYPVNRTDQTNLSDHYWVSNFEVNGTISSVVLSWKIHNLMNSNKTILSNIFGDLNPDYLWIQNHPDFPMMGRLVYFQIDWEFRD